jgi:hypothetical protein
VCDPNTCTQTTAGPGDVDAGVLSTGEGGVSIIPITGGGGDGGGDGAVCKGLQCAVQSCGGSTNGTTISGKVFDPAGNNPLYNAWVYIPVDPAAPLPPFTQGVTCDTCAGAGTFNALSVAQTADDGTFTLTKVPSGTNIPIIVQMGKWRRKITLPAVAPCVNNALNDGTLRLPRNRFDGDGNTADIPQIAFVSGNADPFQCMLLKTGLDPNEFGSLTLNPERRIHYYNSPDAPSSSIDSSFGNVITADTLWNSKTNLAKYDVVILACEGKEYTTKKSTSGYANLVNYAAVGGRLFMSHYSYVWMKYNTPWKAIPAGWGTTSSVDTQDPMTAYIDTTTPKGVAFSDWLYNVGASTAKGQLVLHQARQDTTSPLAAAAQSWMSATDTVSGALNPPLYSPSFTYNTPITSPAASQCGRVVFSDFHVSTSALTSSANCTTNADCGFGATCSVGTVGTCSLGSCSPNTVTTDCGDSKFSCAGAGTGTCSRASCTNALQISKNCQSGKCTANGSGNYVCGCTQDSDCGKNGKCNTGTNVCTTIPTSCTKDSNCRGSGQNGDATCVNGACVRTACGAVKASCNSGVCATVGGQSVCGCTLNSDCGKNGICNTTTHVCTVGSCGSSGDCFGSAETGDATCTGLKTGTCSPYACTTNTDCDAEKCKGGVCNGCYTNADCPGSATCTGGVPGGTCSGTSSNFPYACIQGKLTPQEAALEFELFDLSSCVSPDGAPPPPPPTPVIAYYPVTFTEDFTATCPSGTHVAWREVDWQASIPSTASIVFSAQTADSAADGGPPDYTSVQSVKIATATSSTLLPAWDAALIDIAGDGGTKGAFNAASPPVSSRQNLRLSVTLNPTSDMMSSPTLIQWRVLSDCPPTE